MKVRKLLQKLETELAEYMDYDLDKDWQKCPHPEDVHSMSLYEKLKDIFFDSSMAVRYFWDYDDSYDD